MAWNGPRTWPGIGIAVVIWASAAFAGYESIRKLIEHGHTSPYRRGYRRGGHRHHRQPGRRPVQAGRRQAHRIRHAHRRCPAFLAGCPVLGRGARRPDRGGSGPALGRPGSRAGRSPRSSATSATRSPATSCTAWPTASTPTVIRTAEAAAGSVPGVDPRARPGPLDRPDAARRDRRLGRSRHDRTPGRRRSAARSPTPLPGSSPRQAALPGPPALPPDTAPGHPPRLRLARPRGSQANVGGSHASGHPLPGLRLILIVAWMAGHCVSTGAEAGSASCRWEARAWWRSAPVVGQRDLRGRVPPIGAEWRAGASVLR